MTRKEASKLYARLYRDLCRVERSIERATQIESDSLSDEVLALNTPNNFEDDVVEMREHIYENWKELIGVSRKGKGTA